MSIYAQFLLNGLIAAAIYSLVGIAIAITFRLCRRLDMSLGGWVAVGAYCVVPLAKGWSAGIWLPFFAACIAAVCAAQQLFLDRRTSGEGRAGLLVSLGALTVMQISIAYFFGNDRRALSLGNLGEWRIGSTVVSGIQIAIVLAAAATLVILYFSMRTPWGREVRAIGASPELAREIGIPIEHRRLVGFGACGILAATAGGLLGVYYGAVPGMGLSPVLKGLTGAVMGGMTVRGVLAGSLALGLVEHLSIIWIATLWQEPLVFTFLITFLVLRGRGLWEVDR